MNKQGIMADNGDRQNIVSNRSKNAYRRLKQDYLMMMKDPAPYVTVAPLPSDILEWHYVIRGPENTVYHGGIYHGKLRFPSEYPFKPPSIFMITPNGRFKTDTRLCLSISDFHPDTWNPTWSLSTILTGFLSFMLDEDIAVGSIQSTDSARRALAKKSLQFNLNNSTFVELFPKIADEIRTELENQKRAAEESSLKNNLKAIKDRVSHTLQPGGSAESDRFIRFVWSCIYNLMALFILVLFFFIVQWVLSNKNMISE